MDAKYKAAVELSAEGEMWRKTNYIQRLSSSSCSDTDFDLPEPVSGKMYVCDAAGAIRRVPLHSASCRKPEKAETTSRGNTRVSVMNEDYETGLAACDATIVL